MLRASAHTFVVKEQGVNQQLVERRIVQRQRGRHLADACPRTAYQGCCLMRWGDDHAAEDRAAA